MGSYVGVCVSRSSAAPQSVSPSFCKRTRIWGLRSSKHEHLLDLFVNISSVEDRMCMLCLGNNERFIYVVLKELSDILFDMESTRLSGSHGLGCGRQFRGVAQGALLWPEAERFQASQSTPSGSIVAFAGNYHNYAFFFIFKVECFIHFCTCCYEVRIASLQLLALVLWTFYFSPLRSDFFLQYLNFLAL